MAEHYKLAAELTKEVLNASHIGTTIITIITITITITIIKINLNLLVSHRNPYVQLVHAFVFEGLDR